MVTNRPFHGLVSSRDQTLALYTQISVWFRILSEQPIQNIQEFGSDGAWKVSFVGFQLKWQKWPDPLAGPGAFKRGGNFL